MLAALRRCSVVTVLLLTACSTLPRTNPSAARSDGTVEANTELTGRISVHFHNLATDHDETDFASFDWSEHGETVDLDLLNPLSQVIARVHAAPDASTLTLSDGRVFSGATPEALTLQVLGWTLPVRGLRAWLLGQTSRPDTPAASLNADGGERLVEDGWTVLYPDGLKGAPPRRLNLSYPGPGIALELRIVIDTRTGA